MNRAYKYRFYPTPEQAQLLAQTFGCTHFVYNHVLRWRTDAFFRQQEKVGYLEANAELTRLKRSGELPWLNEVSCIPLQQCLRHQQIEFRNFFADRTKYPAFKSRKHRQFAEFTRSAFSYRDGKQYLAKSGTPLDIRWSRPLPGEPSTISVSKDSASRYFVSCLCEFESEVLPITPQMIGIDLGLKDLFVTSEGERIGDPRHNARYVTQLALAQRRPSRKKLGSKNRAKALLKVTCIHARISDTAWTACTSCLADRSMRTKWSASNPSP
ncbi:RNA-guided endonuclease InsQ/TnpB family protein [Azorhizophilus paspali]|uniref:RNA-guided endonuclease InsQ/TnpB family protein n=1 Tax=Azorhizophilus paspali TaxID=69963 RepID=A0ABV6SMN6_AZOPA